MFNSRHYIPILRWKAAEKEALEKLSEKEKKLITPLIEIIMPQPSGPRVGENAKTTEELLEESIVKLKTMIPKIPQEILKFWGNKSAFVDLSLVDSSLRSDGMNQLLSIGRELDISLIPVISLNSEAETQKVAATFAKKYNSGLCLRLFRSDFHSTSLPIWTNKFLSTYRLTKQDVDLLVDLQITDGQNFKLVSLIQQIPDIAEWRTFTVASGAFPKDLTGFTVDLHKIDRTDWNSWLNQINSDRLPRKPSFGDYTIQHPIFQKPIRGANPSASIRYTLETNWMLMRGQGLRSKKSSGHAQYPANAQLLSQRPEFFGADFSYGDAYIEDKGSNLKTKKTGTPRTWLRAGINHHLACVVSQIANLP